MILKHTLLCIFFSLTTKMNPPLLLSISWCSPTHLSLSVTSAAVPSCYCLHKKRLLLTFSCIFCAFAAYLECMWPLGAAIATCKTTEVWNGRSKLDEQTGMPSVFFSSGSPWQVCCSPFGDRACYRGHADECRSILTPKPQHQSVSCACVSVCERVYVCVRHLHVCCCIRKVSGSQDKHRQVLLSFISFCPWGCQFSLHWCLGTCVSMRGGFTYHFIGDYMDSFHGYFSSMNILPSYKQNTISRQLCTWSDWGGWGEKWPRPTYRSGLEGRLAQTHRFSHWKL